MSFLIKSKQEGRDSISLDASSMLAAGGASVGGTSYLGQQIQTTPLMNTSGYRALKRSFQSMNQSQSSGNTGNNASVWSLPGDATANFANNTLALEKLLEDMQSRTELSSNLEMVNREYSRFKLDAEAEISRLKESLNNTGQNFASTDVNRVDYLSKLDEVFQQLVQEKARAAQEEERLNEELSTSRLLNKDLEESLENKRMQLAEASMRLQNSNAFVEQRDKQLKSLSETLLKLNKANALLRRAAAEAEASRKRKQCAEDEYHMILEERRLEGSLPEQLRQCRESKQDNIRLKEELEKIKAPIANIKYLEEENKELKRRTTVLDEQLTAQCELEAERDHLKRLLSDLGSVGGLAGSTLETLATQCAATARENEELRERCEGLRQDVRLLREKSELDRSAHEDCTPQLTALQETIDQLRSERDALGGGLSGVTTQSTCNEELTLILRRHLGSGAGEALTPRRGIAKVTTNLEARIRELEAAVSAGQSRLVAETAAGNEQLARLKAELSISRTQLREALIREEVLSQRLSATRLETAEEDKYRVLHLASNPADNLVKQRLAEYTAMKRRCSGLEAEVQCLSAKLEEARARQNADITLGGLGITQNLEEQSELLREHEQLQAQVKKLELEKGKLTKHWQRLHRGFGMTVYQLFGYSVGISSSDVWKVQSAYAASADDYFLFRRQPNDTYLLIETEYSKQLSEEIAEYLGKYDSVPLFLASLQKDNITRADHQKTINTSLNFDF